MHTLKEGGKTKLGSLMQGRGFLTSQIKPLADVVENQKKVGNPSMNEENFQNVRSALCSTRA